MKLNLQVVTCFLRPALLAWTGLSTLGLAEVRADQIAPIAPSPGETDSPSAGGYGGVVPGTATANPLPQPPPGSLPYLIWTGFQPTATGSRVFIQTTAPVEFEVNAGRVTRGKSTLTVVLRGCRIHMANNRRKLDTRAFPTPVQSVSAKQRRQNVELIITLREAATVTSGTEPGPNGSRFVVLDFPPGKATPIESRPSARGDVASGGSTSGEGWSFSRDEDAGPTEANPKSKGRGAGKTGEATQGGSKNPQPNPSLGNTSQ